MLFLGFASKNIFCLSALRHLLYFQYGKWELERGFFVGRRVSDLILTHPRATKQSQQFND